MKNLSAEGHSEIGGRNLKLFKISVECSRNGMAGHYITSLHKDVRQWYKDKVILINAYYFGLCHRLSLQFIFPYLNC